MEGSYMCVLVLGLCCVASVVWGQGFVCKAGWYVPECNQTCLCVNNTCHPESGLCLNYEYGCATPTCSECVAGRWGSKCENKCAPNCATGTCDTTAGTCFACLPGWFGMKCNSSCSSQNCLLNTCSQTTGHCLACNTGYDGDTCTGCAPGYYRELGGGCQQCSSGCKDNKCDDNTGKCDGCQPGYQGDQCTSLCSSRCTQCSQDGTCTACNGQFMTPSCTECVQGLSKHNTTTCSPCSAFCSTRGCDKVSGNCNGGCRPGYHGQQCDESCFNIADQCVQCTQSGQCTACSGHFQPPQCTACKDGFYPNNGHCSECPWSCHDDTSCSQTTGDCDSCPAGWEGPRCLQQMTSQSLSPSLELTTIGATVTTNPSKVQNTATLTLKYVLLTVCTREKEQEVETTVHARIVIQSEEWPGLCRDDDCSNAFVTATCDGTFSKSITTIVEITQVPDTLPSKVNQTAVSTRSVLFNAAQGDAFDLKTIDAVLQKAEVLIKLIKTCTRGYTYTGTECEAQGETTKQQVVYESDTDKLIVPVVGSVVGVGLLLTISLTAAVCWINRRREHSKFTDKEDNYYSTPDPVLMLSNTERGLPELPSSSPSSGNSEHTEPKTMQTDITDDDYTHPKTIHTGNTGNTGNEYTHPNTIHTGNTGNECTHPKTIHTGNTGNDYTHPKTIHTGNTGNDYTHPKTIHTGNTGNDYTHPKTIHTGNTDDDYTRLLAVQTINTDEKNTQINTVRTESPDRQGTQPKTSCTQDAGKQGTDDTDEDHIYTSMDTEETTF